MTIFMDCQTLRDLRENAGFSVSEAHRQLEVSRQSITNWESGKTQPSTGWWQPLARLYNVPVLDVLCAIAKEMESTDADAD